LRRVLCLRFGVLLFFIIFIILFVFIVIFMIFFFAFCFVFDDDSFLSSDKCFSNALPGLQHVCMGVYVF